jgi:hypothetical protein
MAGAGWALEWAPVFFAGWAALAVIALLLFWAMCRAAARADEEARREFNDEWEDPWLWP